MALTRNHIGGGGGGGWVLSPLRLPSPAIIIAKLHFDALCSIFSRTSFSHLATPCCVGHRHDVGWQCCVVFAGLYECCTVQFRSAYTLFSFKPGYIYSCMPFSSICWITFWFSLLVYQWKLMLPLYSDMWWKWQNYHLGHPRWTKGWKRIFEYCFVYPDIPKLCLNFYSKRVLPKR